MTGKVLQYPEIGEILHTAVLPPGLPVLVNRKPGYRETHAVFGVKYGSIDSTFIPPGGKEPITVPDGIAHFLEHQLFEEERGNAFERFAKLGANSNAFTSFVSTNYLFTATDHFFDNLSILVDFVLTPYFTEKNVAEERGIIEQEIRMYEDSPEWRVYFNLLASLYVRNPVRLDIAGTVESIARITPKLLYDCYHAFYHPANMVLTVAGDVDPERVFEHVAEQLAQKKFNPGGKIERVYPEEPENINRPYIEDHLTISRPITLLGFKDRKVGLTGEELLRRELAVEVLLEALVGKSSALYEELYAENLIGDDFSAQYDGEESFAHVLLGGETTDPHRLAERLRQEIDKVRRTGVGQEQFEWARRKLFGDLLHQLNSPERVGNLLAHDHYRGVDSFARFALLRELLPSAVDEVLHEVLNPEFSSVSVIYPKGEGA